MTTNQTKKILIVDDEPSIVLALESLLKANNYTTEKAYNGKEGLEITKKFNPDLIIASNDNNVNFINSFNLSITIGSALKTCVLAK